jgi:hypothetical protein
MQLLPEVKHHGNYRYANTNGNRCYADNRPHNKEMFFLWLTCNHLFKRLLYFSHGVIISFLIIKAIRVPRQFGHFYKVQVDELFNNFPKVGNGNFTDGKNLLYWGVAIIKNGMWGRNGKNGRGHYEPQ